MNLALTAGDELQIYTVMNKTCFHSLDLEQAEGFVLGEDLSGLVAVQINRKPIGIEPKLFGHLWEQWTKFSN